MLGGRRGLCSYISPTASYATSLGRRARANAACGPTPQRKSYPPPSAPTTLFPATDIDFLLLGIIRSNTTIPVLLTDGDGNILQHRNFNLPEPADTIGAPTDPRNIEYSPQSLADLRESRNIIEIDISPDEVQRLYYEDPPCSKRMSIFPYIQTLVMLAFITVVYFAVLSTKKAEQNKVWVVSKETAHQLGTPISSLMAWMELLPDMGVDRDTLAEMNKRTSTASAPSPRASQRLVPTRVWSPPELNRCVGEAVEYMSTVYHQKNQARMASRRHAARHRSLHATARMAGDREPHKECRRRHGRFGQIDVSTGGTPTRIHRSGRHRQGHKPQELQERLSTPATPPSGADGASDSHPGQNALWSNTTADASS